MKKKKVLKSKMFILYTSTIILLVIMLKHFNLLNQFLNYINCKSTDFKFQDLLSILLTILSIFVGAIITVATVLISMCDKRIMRLIKTYNLSENIIIDIKTAISSGIITVVLLAIIYSNLVFDVNIIRYIVLYISGISLIIFINSSKILILLVLNILDNSFEEDSSIKEVPNFKKPDRK